MVEFAQALSIDCGLWRGILQEIYNHHKAEVTSLEETIKADNQKIDNLCHNDQV